MILTSYVQSIVTGKLCKRRHVVGVVCQDVGLFCNAPGCLLDALIICVLGNKTRRTRCSSIPDMFCLSDSKLCILIKLL